MPSSSCIGSSKSFRRRSLDENIDWFFLLNHLRQFSSSLESSPGLPSHSFNRTDIIPWLHPRTRCRVPQPRDSSTAFLSSEPWLVPGNSGGLINFAVRSTFSRSGSCKCLCLP
ncbi:hypothetical protein TGFOU_464919 [Toxoplasma gondii FOU]|uniref:Uncharacterized protein n=2 Tax=Toxoplasma gondii TaxID=5811 RepID=A0A086K3R1_TOXGO|nr:hypothetical protein TGFOU_464919 [Toxoplasma gondii FOU]PUA86460.1 hypothetical protein TGBR9_214400 [Toxoplasma gondii TgCATBr9]